MTVARRGHVYPTFRLQARDLVNLRGATLPPGARADQALMLATRFNASVLTPAAGARRFVLRDDLSRALALGLGELPALRLARPLPVVTARTTETIVRRHLASGAPAVIVRDETTGFGAVGRAGFIAAAGPPLGHLFAATLAPATSALLVRIGALAEVQGGRAFAVGGVVRECVLSQQARVAPPQPRG